MAKETPADGAEQNIRPCRDDGGGAHLLAVARVARCKRPTSYTAAVELKVPCSSSQFHVESEARTSLTNTIVIMRPGERGAFTAAVANSRASG